MISLVFFRKFLPILFIISFVFSVINISVNGTSFYFYLIIPVVDFWFIVWIFHLKKSLFVYFSVFLVLLILFFSFFFVLRPLHIIKPIVMFFSVAYLYYIYVYRYNSFRYIYIYASVSILMAIIQFILSYIGYGSIFDPSTISKVIWGELAIQTREGFNDGIIFTYRVAGLSKEPGFFSSFLLSVSAIYFCDKKFNSKFFIFLVFVGLIVSMSKITLAFIFLLSIIYFIHRFLIDINKVNLIFGALSVVFFGGLLVGLIYTHFGFIDITYKDPSFSETYLHRSIGYYLLYEWSRPEVLKYILQGGITENLSDVLKVFPF